MEIESHHSLIERERRTTSVFRPPKFFKSAPPHKKTLTATARPWYPTSTATAVAEKKPVAPPRPILAPPTALGLSPDLKPKSSPSLPLLSDITPATPVSSPFSPLSTPVHAFSHTFTDEATAARLYPVDMFMSVRKDAAHTPHGVLRWCVRQYLEIPSLKVPPHLQLSMSEVAASDDGIIRGALGSGLKVKPRAKPVRQVHHKVMSILSRITPQKYTDLLDELLQLPLRQMDETELHDVVRVFFDKAVQEPEFSEIYARLFSELCLMKESERELEAELRDRLFCNRINRELLHTCDEEFRRPIELTPDERVNRTTGTPYSEEEIDLKRMRLKNRLVGNIKFVGELFKLSLVTERVVDDIFHLLMGDFDRSNPTVREDYVFEVFSTLVRTTGDALKERKPSTLTRYLGVAKTVEHVHPRNRIRFLMMDLSDINTKMGWVPIDRVLQEANLHDDTQQSLCPSRGNGAVTASFLPTSTSSPAEEMTHSRSADRPVARPTPLSFRDSTTPASPAIRTGPLTTAPPSQRLYAAPKPHVVSHPPHYIYVAPGKTAAAAVAAERHSSSSGLASPPHGIGYGAPNRFHAAAPPPSFRCPPCVAGPMDIVNIQDVALQLIQNFRDPKEESTVLHCIDEMSLRNKVLCLTWWLRQVSTTTSMFAERQHVTSLFSSILASCPSFKLVDLMSAIIEWIHFDIEKAEYLQCPRMFENIGHMIQYTHAAEVARLPRIEDVQCLLPISLFNVIMRDLIVTRGVDHLVTLAKAAQPIATTLLSSIQDLPTDVGTLRIAMLSRMRLLPYFLSVSDISEGDIPSTPPACRTPTNPTLSSPLGESVTSMGHYDPLCQCLTFSKLAEDPEFVVLRRVRGDIMEHQRRWKEEVIQIALTPVRHGSTVAQIVQVSKVIGALLACSNVVVHGVPLLSPAEVDDIAVEILERCPGTIYQAAAAMEVILHHTQALPGVSQRKSIRVKQLRLAYARWCTRGIIEKQSVMQLLSMLHDPEDSTCVYALYHNAIADPELPWDGVLSYLS